MNFNLSFSLLLILIFLSACGVKSDPVPPKGTALPSYIDKFLDSEEMKKDDKKKKSETTSGS